jgi:hypothetical protein
MILLYTPRFNPRADCVEFVLDKVALEQVFLQIIQFFPFIILLMILSLLLRYVLDLTSWKDITTLILIGSSPLTRNLAESFVRKFSFGQWKMVMRF